MTAQATRIAFVTPTLHAGGSEKQLSMVADHLRERGFETLVIATHDPSGAWAEYLTERGVRILELDTSATGSSLLDDVRRALALSTILRTVRPDGVIAFLYRNSIWAMLAARRANVPLAIAARRDCGFQRDQAPLPRIVESRSYAATTQFVANSGAVARSLGDKEGIDADRISVIYNGVDIPQIDPSDALGARQALGLAAGAPVIGMMANFWPHKNQLMLVRAAKYVVERHPNTMFILAGRTWDYVNDVQREISSLGLEDNFRIAHDMGPKQVVPGIDIGVLCSESEGLSNTILEYMAYGKPVVATEVGGNQECVVDGSTGFLVPLNDERALANKLLAICDDNALRESLGDRGRQRAIDMFSWNASIDAWSQMLAARLPQPGELDR